MTAAWRKRRQRLAWLCNGAYRGGVGPDRNVAACDGVAKAAGGVSMAQYDCTTACTATACLPATASCTACTAPAAFSLLPPASNGAAIMARNAQRRQPAALSGAWLARIHSV